MPKKYLTKSAKQTQKLGQKLAEKIIQKGPGDKTFIVGLQGELGSGKTTFLQGFAKGLGIKEKILSPTFVIMKKFQFNNLTIKQFNNFYHFDCYRLQKPKELIDLGFKEIISNPQNIVTIEWAEKIKKMLPKDALFIRFKFIDTFDKLSVNGERRRTIDKNKREIKFSKPLTKMIQ